MEEENRRSSVRAVFSFIGVLAILGGSVVIAILLIVNQRVAKETEAERVVSTVEVLAVEVMDYPVRILTQGVVESRRETILAAEVAGRVVEISGNLKRGARVGEDERLVQIDPADYRSNMARAVAAAADARLIAAQEEARFEQARLDWAKLGEGAGSPLVLREPQREAALAAVASTEAEVARARRDVERTEIRSPFAASVREAVVEVGAVVAPGQKIATLYSSEDLEIRLALPLEDFGFIQRSSEGAPLGEISLHGKIGGEVFHWAALPLRLDQEIDRRTLSGHLIAKILPRHESKFPLPPVGLFVQADIAGTTLEKVAEVPRRALLEGGRALVVGAEDRIEFRDIRIVRKTRDAALVSEGLAAGERLLLTRLSAPINGMQVRVESAAAATHDDKR
jgi:RND family efflux transporter MFP subunit